MVLPPPPHVTRGESHSGAPRVLQLPVVHHLFHAAWVSFIYFFCPENLNLKKIGVPFRIWGFCTQKMAQKAIGDLDWMWFSLVFFKVLNVEIRVRMQIAVLLFHNVFL